MTFVSLSPLVVRRQSLRIVLSLFAVVLAVLLWAPVSTPVAAQGPTGLDVDIQWGGQETPCPGYSLHFDILVTNRTAAPITGITVQDLLPPHTYFRVGSGRTTPGAIYDPSTRTVRWENVTLEPGQTKIYEILIYLNTTAPVGSTVVNAAEAFNADRSFYDYDEAPVVVAECAPTAITLDSLTAAPAVSAPSALSVALVGVGITSLGGLVAIRRRRQS
jgi:uncharacterized repeat protein (TIGR01451 family)